MRYLTELSLDAFITAARSVPYQQISSELFPGIDLWIRRDDLIDPLISGNKAYKLIYNLLEARAQGKDTIVTCGGAWSNHIHATAAAGQRFGFKTVGIIRGERPPVLSAMLQDAERFGMELRFISRIVYREREQPTFIGKVGYIGSNHWFIPEGGANALGAKGVHLLGRVINETSPVRFDECWVACGTGLTLGGLASSFKNDVLLYGVPVLKAEKAIQSAAVSWSRALSSPVVHPRILEGGHFGGYAKVTDELREFTGSLSRQAGVLLDLVYVGKAALLMSQRAKSSFQDASWPINRRKVLLLQTGGLQGIRGHCA